MTQRAKPKIWVSPTGERWYSIQTLCSILGKSAAEVQQLVSAGMLPPGQPRGGGSTLYFPEWAVSQVERMAKASPVFPYSF
jgi:hypothetical protein